MSQESLLVILGGAVMASLVSAVVFLFSRFEIARSELTKKFEAELVLVYARLKDCEDDRINLRNQIIAIHKAMHEMKQRLP